MARGRVVLVPLLMVAGAGLLAYGLLYNSIPVSSKPAVSEPVVPGLDGEFGLLPVVVQTERVSEPVVTREVARGGVTRDAESGRIQKTYEGTEAPKACPT